MVERPRHQTSSINASIGHATLTALITSSAMANDAKKRVAYEDFSSGLNEYGSFMRLHLLSSDLAELIISRDAADPAVIIDAGFVIIQQAGFHVS